MSDVRAVLGALSPEAVVREIVSRLALLLLGLYGQSVQKQNFSTVVDFHYCNNFDSSVADSWFWLRIENSRKDRVVVVVTTPE